MDIRTINNISERYYLVFGNTLNLVSPTTFTEKLQYLKIYEDMSLKIQCADKISLKTHLSKENCAELVIPTIQITDSVNHIQLDYKNCIIKCNHGSMMNITVTDHIRQKDLLRLNNWLKTDYSKQCFETWYHYITPRLLVEPVIPSINDLKVFCFNGIPRIYENGSLSEHYLNYYDTNWNFMPEICRRKHPSNTSRLIPTPYCLDKVFEYSKILAKPFKFVRIDFIFNDTDLYCNEFTFCPGGGFQEYVGNGDTILGNMLSI